MGSSSSHIAVPTMSDWTTVNDLYFGEDGKVGLGDIIEFANGVFGILTSLNGSDGNVITVINGIVKEVPINSVDATAKKNNFFDNISAPYDAGVIVKKAQDSIGKDADDSKSFVMKCRNGVF